MRVLLINPPLPGEKPSRELLSPPLGLAYVASYLEAHGFNVEILDCPALGLSLKLAKKALSSRRADVFGITMTSLTVKPAALVASWIKRSYPDSLVMVGGAHPTFADTHVLTSIPGVDVVVRGEGELTALELVQRRARGEGFEGVKGITYRSRDGVVRSQDRELIEDLDSLPFPAYHLLPVQNYRSFGAKEPTFTVLTSRGCPFNCKFCVAWKMNKRRYRARSVKNVVDELEYLVHRFKARFLSFVDDLFTINKDRVKALCRAIKERCLNLVWGCETRVDMVDRETLVEMRKAGCYWIYFGLESASQGILDSMRKGIRVEQIRNAFNLCREVGINTIASVMLFWPGETRETVRKTLKLLKEVAPDAAHFSISTPFIGSDFYEEVEGRGLLKVKDWEQYDLINPVYEAPGFTMEEMRRQWAKAYLSFYLRPSYLVKQLLKGNRDVVRMVTYALIKYLRVKLGKLLPSHLFEEAVP